MFFKGIVSRDWGELWLILGYRHRGRKDIETNATNTTYSFGSFPEFFKAPKPVMATCLAKGKI